MFEVSVPGPSRAQLPTKRILLERSAEDAVMGQAGDKHTQTLPKAPIPTLRCPAQPGAAEIPSLCNGHLTGHPPCAMGTPHRTQRSTPTLGQRCAGQGWIPPGAGGGGHSHSPAGGGSGPRSLPACLCPLKAALPEPGSATDQATSRPCLSSLSYLQRSRALADDSSVTPQTHCRGCFS